MNTYIYIYIYTYACIFIFSVRLCVAFKASSLNLPSRKLCRSRWELQSELHSNSRICAAANSLI